jgi:hypothetical protein
VAGGRGWFPVVGRPSRSWCPEGDQGLRGPADGSVAWISTIEPRTWAKVTSYRDDGRVVVTRLVAFDASGKQLLRTRPEQVGDSALVGSGGRLWSLGVGGNCNGPQRLWSVDAATGNTELTATLRSPVKPCLTEGGSQLAVVGHSIFVLDPTDASVPAGVLYRITP